MHEILYLRILKRVYMLQVFQRTAQFWGKKKFYTPIKERGFTKHC